MEVPFIDLKQRYEEEKDELLECVARTLENGSLVLTPELGELDSKFVISPGPTIVLALILVQMAF